MPLALLLLMLALAGPTASAHPEPQLVDEAGTPVRVVTDVPHVVARDLQGRTRDLSAESALSPVLVIFWHPGCPHCLSSLSAIHALVEMVGVRLEVFVVGPATASEIDALRPSMAASGIRLTILPDSDGRLAQAFGVGDRHTALLLRSGS